MATVTYKNQPGFPSSVPLAGTKHLYTVTKVLWHPEIETFLADLLLDPCLHVCSGLSKLGDVRLDLNEPTADIHCDAADMRAHVADDSYRSVLCDPPYSNRMQWNHDLLSELARVASERIIFQHWFIPANGNGLYKKARDKFELTAAYVWQPRTYFGRAQVISVFDRRLA